MNRKSSEQPLKREQPEREPSGVIEYLIHVETNDEDVTMVSIAQNPPSPIDLIALANATTHMMTLTAMEMDNFDAGLDALVEAAKSNLVHLHAQKQKGLRYKES